MTATPVPDASAIGGNEGAPLESILQQVQQIIDFYQSEPDSAIAPLKKVRLEMTAVAETRFGAGIEFKIPRVNITLKFGPKYSREQSQTLTLDLVPHWDRTIVESDLKGSLLSGLRDIRRAVKQAKGGNPPLDLEYGSVEFSFVVSSEMAVEIVIVSFGAVNGTTHRLTVELGPSA